MLSVLQRSLITHVVQDNHHGPSPAVAKVLPGRIMRNNPPVSNFKRRRHPQSRFKRSSFWCCRLVAGRAVVVASRLILLTRGRPRPRQVNKTIIHPPGDSGDTRKYCLAIGVGGWFRENFGLRLLEVFIFFVELSLRFPK